MNVIKVLAFILLIALGVILLFTLVFLGLCRMVSFGSEDFAKRYGTLSPSQFVDVIALIGDKSDNIPGWI